MDGTLGEASFAQPSGLTSDGTNLYVQVGDAVTVSGWGWVTDARMPAKATQRTYPPFGTPRCGVRRLATAAHNGHSARVCCACREDRPYHHLR